MTIDRKVTSSKTNASPRTKPKTSGRRAFIVSLKSREPEVAPPTYAWAPAARPSVAGMILLRNVDSACSEGLSVPLPTSEIVTAATVRA
jgi:hypothetical protein